MHAKAGDSKDPIHRLHAETVTFTYDYALTRPCQYALENVLSCTFTHKIKAAVPAWHTATVVVMEHAGAWANEFPGLSSSL